MRYCLILIFILLVSCSSSIQKISKKDLPGKYEIFKPKRSIYNNYKKEFGTSFRVLSGKLEIMETGDFRYETCGMIITGPWTYSDSLVLLNPIDKIVKTKPKEISEQEFMDRLRPGFFKLYLRNNHLVSAVNRFSSNDKSLIIMSKLNKQL